MIVPKQPAVRQLPTTRCTQPVVHVCDAMRRCRFNPEGAHDFDAHTVEGIVISMHCRRCGLVLPQPGESF